ncbi:MAG: exopolyphosphatase [Bacteroidetes bacterium]|nr:exopolyphosphatase [Bacteroidota bacterium]
MRLAAIDIGSNAVRLLISEVQHSDAGEPEFAKLNLVRVPIRLGFDVFDTGEISPERTAMLVESLMAFRHLLRAYDVRHVKACATSAMRDAQNAPEILEKVRASTGFEVEVISGDAEASLIYENHIAEHMDRDDSYLYIDVGGGSTEVTLFGEGRMISKQSFDIGTIRVLKGKLEERHWDGLKEYLREATKRLRHVTAIGSGGNINKVFSLSQRKDGKPLTLEILRDLYKEFSACTLEQRMALYRLREDRADVIVPALQIYISAMRWAGCEEIFVPKIGLADGLVQHLYKDLLRD